jgi:hypothetical protein
MKRTNTVQTIGVKLLVVLALLAVLTFVFAGTAGAQSTGTVTITTDEITSASSSFDVEITSLVGTSTGCLEATNLGTGETVEINSAFEGDQFAIFQSELGGFEAGDVVVATLYDDPNDCTFALSSDSRTVQPAAVFEVSIDSTNSPVTEGETADVTASIENIGETQGTQTVELIIGDVESGRTLEDDSQLTLDSGESQQVVLSWDIGQADLGIYDATVTSEDDSDLASINVEEAPANFDVAIDTTNSPVVEGETVVVTATFTNTGDQQGTQTITATAGSLGSITRTVTLDGGESRTETFPVPTSAGDAGTYTITVESENDTATTGVTVEEEDNGGTGSSPVDGISDELWTAVTANDESEGLSLSDLGNAIQQYQANPSDADIGGVSIGLSDLGSLIRYYRTEVV